MAIIHINKQAVEINEQDLDVWHSIKVPLPKRKQRFKRAINQAFLIALMFGGYSMMRVATDTFGVLLGLGWFFAAVLNLINVSLEGECRE